MNRQIYSIAVMSDIHGNLTAFKAVLDDCKKYSINEYWFLGDLLMPGPGGRELLSEMIKTPFTIKILGNWDEKLFEAIKPDYLANKPITRYFQACANFVNNELISEHYDYLDSFTRVETRIINHKNIQITHHFADKNFGRELVYNGAQADFDRLCLSANCDIALFGHVHVQMLRYSSSGQLIINPGSIGQPFSVNPHFVNDVRAHYALLHVDEDGKVDVEFKKIAYDIEQELQFARSKKLPYYQIYERVLTTGELHTHDHEYLESLRKAYHY